MKRHVHSSLDLLAAAGDTDQGVYVLWMKLQRLIRAWSYRHQVLPCQRHCVCRVKGTTDDIRDTIGLLGRATELPDCFLKRDGDPGLCLEFLEVCLSRAIGIGLGKGELRINIEPGWCDSGSARQLVQQPSDAHRLEREPRIDARDEMGRGLKAERLWSKSALLALIHADQIDGTRISDTVLGG